MTRWPSLTRSAMACRRDRRRCVSGGTGVATGRFDLISRRPRCTAATGSSHKRARTTCSSIVAFMSSPVPTGRELRSGSLTSMAPASASTRVRAPATAILESLCFLAIRFLGGEGHHSDTCAVSERDTLQQTVNRVKQQSFASKEPRPSWRGIQMRVFVMLESRQGVLLDHRMDRRQVCGFTPTSAADDSNK